MVKISSELARSAQLPDGSRAALGRFDVTDTDAYHRWREQKLADYPASVDELIVEVHDPFSLTPTEHERVYELCRKTNMAIYTCRRPPADSKAAIHALARQFGLVHPDRNLCADEDGIAVIRVVPDGRRQEYIPYSERPINWHTDGYYNRPEQQVRGLAMYCVADAASGGANALADPEVVYIHMRDENPDYVAALMQGDAMIIPANVEDGRELRPERAGPVFSVNAGDGALHMRYTARTRSIRWKNDGITAEAAAFLAAVLHDELSPSFRIRLRPGQGILCNNVLHTRGPFVEGATEGKKRIHLRARYYDRIRGT